MIKIIDIDLTAKLITVQADKAFTKNNNMFN